jgi:hypothetical protein
MKFRRLNILIDPKFQLKFLVFFGLCMALNILVLFGAVNFFYYRMKNSLSGAGLEKGSVIWSFIEGQQYELNILFAVISIISLFILFFGWNIPLPQNSRPYLEDEAGSKNHD